MELFCQFVPLACGVFCLGVDCSDDESKVSALHLGADGLVIIESLPALMRDDSLLFEHDGSLAVVLVLGLLAAFFYRVFGVDHQGVGGRDGFFRAVHSGLDVDLEVGVVESGKPVVGLQFVEVLALGVEPVDVLEEDAQAGRVSRFRCLFRLGLGTFSQVCLD